MALQITQVDPVHLRDTPTGATPHRGYFKSHPRRQRIPHGGPSQRGNKLCTRNTCLPGKALTYALRISLTCTLTLTCALHHKISLTCALTWTRGGGGNRGKGGQGGTGGNRGEGGRIGNKRGRGQRGDRREGGRGGVASGTGEQGEGRWDVSDWEQGHKHGVKHTCDTEVYT